MILVKVPCGALRGGEGIQDIPAEIEKGVIMGAYDWTSGLITFGTQLAPGIIAVGLALMAALAARTKAMPALVFASGLSTALSLVGVLMGLKQYAHALEASSFYDTIDAYVLCAITLVVLTYGLDAIALVRGRSQGKTV